MRGVVRSGNFGMAHSIDERERLQCEGVHLSFQLAVFRRCVPIASSNSHVAA